MSLVASFSFARMYLLVPRNRKSLHCTIQCHALFLPFGAETRTVASNSAQVALSNYDLPVRILYSAMFIGF